MEFFESAEMCKAINCTTITLIAYRSLDLYPVALMIRDNIIMSHELVKGYERKNISPRCMLKIDMQKAYDSVEWVYIEQVMKLLGVPEKFVKCIMVCISTVSYSVIINGKPTKPFEARKGLRQGRHTISQESTQQFLTFSAASGLIANSIESCIYFGGVDNRTQQHIMDMLGYTKGELPFRYLGVPLSTKRLTVMQCEPLIDRMLSRIQCWTTNFLSYTGRAMLIKSVLVAIQKFWTQIFVLLKKIIQFIETICKRFLWSGSVEPTKKALIAWDKLCAPKVAGGLNFINVELWNKEAICKLLWNICTQKEKLWFQWIHAYYIKGNTIWNIEPKSASWIIQKIFKAKRPFENAGHSE
ncbi:PREDICTED: uncharacterized protein LOC109233778 [Nicotiana attenuata]|uniref:uncharacterized protein LOC109233778 n=1 Tax=Nicotiana attenuata TaxID=49451 RepID=UPI000905C9F7|nr:PREDICTED: uncharacterized protein LOC109233778 [Nicotiana attenuata]